MEMQEPPLEDNVFLWLAPLLILITGAVLFRKMLVK